MTYPINDEFTMTMPLPFKMRYQAEQFRQQQPTAQKAKQVYLNTLAVQVVQAYLAQLGIKTALDTSDSWSPALQALADIADLILPGKGRLECRPVPPGAAHCAIPPEVWHDRIGYVAVQFNPTLTEAQLLGFVPTVSTTELPLTQLRSLGELLDHLDQVTVSQTPVSQTEEDALPIRLNRWLQGEVTAGWQAIETLLPPRAPAVSFRGWDSQLTNLNPFQAIIQGKLLDLADSAGDRHLVLVVRVMPTTKLEMVIWVTLYTTGMPPMLPPDLVITILNEANVAVMQARSQETEMIRLEFSGVPGDRFSIEVALQDRRVVELFVI